MQPRFAMFYEDETIVDDGETVEVTFRVPRAWIRAPKHGLQGVLWQNHDGKLVPYEGNDYYAVLTNGQPFATPNVAPSFCREGLVKYGVQLEDERFDNVRERMRRSRKEWEQR